MTTQDRALADGIIDRWIDRGWTERDPTLLDDISQALEAARAARDARMDAMLAENRSLRSALEAIAYMDINETTRHEEMSALCRGIAKVALERLGQTEYDDLTMPREQWSPTWALCAVCHHAIQPGLRYRRIVRLGKADRREHMACPACTCHQQGA